jgi:HAMP domain-containing protein
MSTPVTSSIPTPGTELGVPKRRLRNYLLDARIQLKFTAYMLAVSVGIAVLLGTFLVNTTQALLRETQEAVEARSVAAETSRELSRATLTDQLLQRMNDPVFARQLEEESRRIDARYEQERLAVVTARSDLVRRQKVTWLVLAGTLVAFIAIIALTTIVVTHRVVGPIYRIRRLIHAVADGDLQVSTHQLREADELKDLFADVTGMVHSLRSLQEEDLAALDRAVRAARDAGAGPEALAQLEVLSARLRGRLGDEPTA